MLKIAIIIFHFLESLFLPHRVCGKFRIALKSRKKCKRFIDSGGEKISAKTFDRTRARKHLDIGIIARSTIVLGIHI